MTDKSDKAKKAIKDIMDSFNCTEEQALREIDRNNNPAKHMECSKHASESSNDRNEFTGKSNTDNTKTSLY